MYWESCQKKTLIHFWGIPRGISAGILGNPGNTSEGISTHLKKFYKQNVQEPFKEDMEVLENPLQVIIEQFFDKFLWKCQVIYAGIAEKIFVKTSETIPEHFPKEPQKVPYKGS